VRAINEGLAHYNSMTGVWEWGPVGDSISLKDAMPDMVRMPEPKPKK